MSNKYHIVNGDGDMYSANTERDAINIVKDLADGYENQEDITDDISVFFGEQLAIDIQDLGIQVTFRKEK